MSFGEFLKERRKVIGLSQVELADSLNYSPQVISKWEKGTTCPPLSLSSEIAKLLELSLEDYFKMDPSAPRYTRNIPPFNQEAFSKQLKIHRTYSGLTQKRVNELTGINYQTIQRFENGKSIPSIEEFLKLADTYNQEPIAIYEAKDIVDIAKTEDIPAKKLTNKLLISLSVASLVAIASISAAIILLSKSSNTKTPDNSSSMLVEDSTILEDFSFTSSQVKNGEHDEYELTVKFKNIDKYKRCGYICKINYKDSYITDVKTLSLSAPDDEYVSVSTTLTEYSKSGEYSISSLLGLYPKMDNGVMTIEEEEIPLAGLANTITINNPKQDITAPVLKSLKMSDMIDKYDPNCFMFCYSIECEDDLSGIKSLTIKEHYSNNLHQLGWYGANYVSLENYPSTHLKDDLLVRGSMPDAQLTQMKSELLNVDYFLVTILDQVNNVTTVSLPAAEVLAY